MKTIFARCLSVLVVIAVLSGGVAAADDSAKIKQLETKVERADHHALLDRIGLTGDYRFQIHTLGYEFPTYYDGMQMQGLMVNSLFAVGSGLVPMPQTPEQAASFVDDVNAAIGANYAEYLAFSGGLTYEGLQQMMGSFSPEQQQGLMALLQPQTLREGYKTRNDALYTNRLRLNLTAKVAENISFTGRLSMYKSFGDATGVQVFNGQSNSFIVDGNTASVPNGDFVRVERAYFTWKDLFHAPLYLSIGRRPSTDGPPLHYRHDEKRGGSPMGTLIDFQFDGITAGWNINDWNTLRLCYGVGYESQYANGVMQENPLDDALFFGVNWDLYDTERMFIQTTFARGFNVTDGFNGLVVLPDNPVTGQPVGAPLVMRFTPSANLGDIDIAGILLTRRDGPIDYFGSFNYMKSHPDNVTTPFGGLFCDPFQTPESQDATMWYFGARYNFNKEKTKFGLEYNHGSEYWFNFTPAQDDIIAPKTNTRGDVWEGYLTHRIARRFIVKLAYINYNYKYSGSGWHVGAPKELEPDDGSAPMVAYPTYSNAWALTLGLTARF
jgi:hypothetical protein